MLLSLGLRKVTSLSSKLFLRKNISFPSLQRQYHLTMASNRRPEHTAPPELFYNDDEARKYTSNSRMIEIQMTMSERAIELLSLPEDTPSFILDIGCGSGLSGEALTEQGHHWVGMDISSSMLDIAIEREVDGDVCLRRGSKAVFQFYPENPSQLELITSQAMRAGFTGGLVVDFPNSTRAKKMFLCLFAGVSNPTLPKALGTGNDRGVPTQASFTDSRMRYRNMKGKSVKKSREWIKEKKERRRRQGKGEVRPDSKYTGRKRSGKAF
nr:probable 18S rRNA (guanine-N(7))-methyltransferase [Lytechinus pictus]